MELIPSIDLRAGRVVRLFQGDDDQRTDYGDDPGAVLAAYRRAGVRHVHVVDLDGAFADGDQSELLAGLARDASAAGPSLQLGGGLRDEAAVVRAFDAGFERAVVGSLAVRDPKAFGAIARRFPGRLVPALDCRDEAPQAAGWTEDAAASLDEVCGRLAGLPCPAVLVTDVGRDGALIGPNVDLARRVGEMCGIPALVSGGVRSLEDLTACRVPGVVGVIVGRALYDGRFTVEEAMAALAGGGAS